MYKSNSDGVCVLLKSIIDPHTDMSQFSEAPLAQAAEVRPGAGEVVASCSFFQLFAAAAGTKASLGDAREIFHPLERSEPPHCAHFHPILKLVCTLLKCLYLNQCFHTNIAKARLMSRAKHAHALSCLCEVLLYA